MSSEILIGRLIHLLKPVVLELGYEFYYVEFVNEEGENYLRVYIDNEVGISLTDCEKVSRRISEILDEKDPIESSYYLEVSSPGVFRTLFTDEHLNKYIGYAVAVSLNQLFIGRRKLNGKLISFDEESIVIKTDEEDVSIPRTIISTVTLEGEL